MHIDWWIVALAAMGHVCLLVWLINVSHALGAHEHWMARIVAAIAVVWFAFTLFLLRETLGIAWPAWPAAVRWYALLCVAPATIGFTLSIWRLYFRRPPNGVSGRETQTLLAEPGEASAFVGQGKYSWMFRLPGNDTLQLLHREWRIELPHLPASLDGLSILQVSDLHLAPCFDVSYFESVFDAAARWSADLVVFTGDLVDHPMAIEWIEPVMSRLRGRLGTFAILGNHDYSFDVPAIRRSLAKAGFVDIDGRWTHIDLGDATLAVGGTSAPWGPALDFSGSPEADLRIVLSHTPDLFPRAAAQGVDLVLAGHNHGGQIRLPLVGPVFMPSRYGRHYDRGFFRRGRSFLHVSQGVAGKHPLRVACAPEITRLALHSVKDNSLFLGAIAENFENAK